MCKQTIFATEIAEYAEISKKIHTKFRKDSAVSEYSAVNNFIQT